ncbi:MAG: cyclic pyranopterin monophosphate synthase MoaC [Methanosarcinales archaeon]
MGEVFTHISDDRAVMVDISEKSTTKRCAIATGRIILQKKTIDAIKNSKIKKGNVLATATVAAIMAVKKTQELIPMCHQIPITSIDVDFKFETTDYISDSEASELSDTNAITVQVEVKSLSRTGVEMEALTGVSVALLTIWDMVKSAEKDSSGNYPDTIISSIRVIKKVKI